MTFVLINLDKIYFKKRGKMERDFLQHIYRKFCECNEDLEKANEIEHGVKKILNECLDDLGKDHTTFTNLKVIEVGSFYEKTKVGAPDEFDFMIVLGNQSFLNAITFQKGCDTWHKKICDKTEFVDKDNLYSITRIDIEFWKKLYILCKNKTYQVTTKYGKIITNGCSTGKLMMLFERNSSLNLLMENEEKKTSLLSIGVDLMLAIDYPNIEEVVMNEGFPHEWRQCVQTAGCHLVPKTCTTCNSCWYVSLASAETRLMLDMDTKHKQAYKVLKYLITMEVPTRGKCANLSSYVLKNAFLFHTKSQNDCVGIQDATVCIHKVLDYLSISFRKGIMPCFLSRNIHTWGFCLQYPVICITSSVKTPITFHDDENLTLEWYALCWLELFHRFVVRADKLLKDAKSPDDPEIQTQLCKMKKSLNYLVESSCKADGLFQKRVLQKTHRLPNVISYEIFGQHFAWYLRKLKESFDVELDYLLH